MPNAKNTGLKDFLAKQLANISSTLKMWRLVLPALERKAYRLMVDEGDPLGMGPRREREDKFYIATNLLRALFTAYDRGAPAVKDKLIGLFLTHFLIGSSEAAEARTRFEEKHGFSPPCFLVISPAGSCNLSCSDCYAASLRSKMNSLSAEVFDWILREKYEDWGSWFTVISGGEPFLWRDGEVDLIEMARRHPEQYFMVYTNGTLIDERTAERLAEVGNITPAISVEGFEEETDRRRGKGTFKKILAAFENLRRAGVPFGISTTAIPQNAKLLLSDEFIRFFFDEQGALYQWIFQYMPIGRGVDVERQVPPELRKWMWQREQELLRKERRFIADFWNGGTFASGCIAAGRSGGYFYIDWNGNITPCAFVPYGKDNVNDLYASGRRLSDALFSDLLKLVREWQRSYNYLKPPCCRGNEIRPCFIRDHYETAREIIKRTGAKPLYPSAAESLEDEDYFRKMLDYDRRLAELLDPIWNELYLEPLPEGASAEARAQAS